MMDTYARAPCNAHRISPWTPARVARALRLYLEEGFTAAEVADAPGAGFSRGAVIGKIRRLGHLKRESRDAAGPGLGTKPTKARRRSNQPSRLERRLPPFRPPQPLPPLREIGSTGTPTTLAALGPGLCRWPIDDPGPGRMYAALFCGGPAVDGRYCRGHRAIAMVAAGPSKTSAQASHP